MNEHELERSVAADARADCVEVDLETGEQIYEGEIVEASVPLRRDMYPSQIGVWCDRCRVIFEGDFMVCEDDDQRTRFGYARKHLNGKGWRCDDTGDFCPDCKDKEPAVLGTGVHD